MAYPKMNFLPVSINISGKNILIIGGGNAGYHKAMILSRFTDGVRIVSPELHEGFDDLPFLQIRKKYEPDDLRDAFLVYACTGDEALNARIRQDANRLGILVSVCDNPALCDFISPAIYREGHLTIAVSSDARDVRQSIDVRNQIRKLAADGKLKTGENGTCETD
jgi:siroheme synthase-like protein